MKMKKNKATKSKVKNTQPTVTVTIKQLAAELGLDEASTASCLMELEAHNMIKKVSDNTYAMLSPKQFI